MQIQESNTGGTLSSMVYQKILISIINGEYPVTEKLPSEAKLCEKYSVSRPVLRDALTRLKEDNLIVSRRGSGSFVVKRPDETVLSFSKISSISDIQRCFEFRTNLEGSAAGLAATRRTAVQLNRIIGAAEKIKEANSIQAVASDEDFEFHLAIAEASNNQYYSTVMKSLRENIKEGMNITRTLSLRSADHNRITLVQDEHDAIVKHIVDGDAKNAELAMRAHLNNARVRMFEGTDS
ncbi:GntR family transcriptional regulator [Oceanisphaera profunda]|uniref:GntR family transcriptional regulator n=1 Tax=Oceanisphaera profunda TaxID=1416627 RepID=A0A1Y0D8K6_9GAMM|nr:FadR/GntR family transcriptional regulator [Oceanisphaera profunda]ART83879.1 GntR family transcriptional regulator [Oceanisphaera profunda]